MASIASHFFGSGLIPRKYMAKDGDLHQIKFVFASVEPYKLFARQSSKTCPRWLMSSAIDFSGARLHHRSRFEFCQCRTKVYSLIFWKTSLTSLRPKGVHLNRKQPLGEIKVVTYPDCFRYLGLQRLKKATLCIAQQTYDRRTARMTESSLPSVWLES